MAGTIRSRLNHYQILGISPTAGSDEIARAFAKEGSVLRPHAFGVLAELCIAYETLRDPIKRRAYDASIGLERKPILQTLPAGARQALLARGPAAAHPRERPASATARTRSAQPAFEQRPEPPTKPALPLGPDEDLTVTSEPRLGRGDMHRLELEAELGVEARPVEWSRTAIVLGTVVLGACVMGGLAGWWSASGVSEASPPEKAMAISLPPSKPLETVAAPAAAAAPAPMVPKAKIDRPKPVIAAASSIDSTPAGSETAADEPQTAQVQADASPEQASSEQTSLATPAASTGSISMPLPDRVIARTIHRIGYSCGSVASTVPVEGEAPGVFKVTCSSGQTYQARPVKGRYRFRRLSTR